MQEASAEDWKTWPKYVDRAEVRRLPTVMNSFQSGHRMGSHTSRMERSHINAVQKKGSSDYFVGNSLQYDGVHQW